MTPRARARVLLVAVLAVLGGACVSVPTDGPVVEGRSEGDPVAPPNVAVLPSGPRPGDEPEAIVEGFLSAMASYEPGYPTAREYLTPEASSRWSPESGIAVYGAGEGSRNVSTTEDGLKIALRLDARVAEDGSYTAAGPRERLVLDLRVSQVAGEWRIDSPPEGLVMTAFDFNREFTAYSSYFFDPGYDVLVPDQTYLPVRGNLPTLLVQELLDGPTQWLNRAVRSAIDPGVSLTSGSVVQVGTVAQVDLSAQVAIASPEQRDRLAAQLAWTLRQAPGVSEVALLAAGQPVPLTTSPNGVVSAEAFAFYDPAAIPAGDLLFAISDQRVVAVQDDVVDPVAGPLGTTDGYRSVAVSPTGTQAAAVEVDGSAVVISGLTNESQEARFEVGSDLAAPSFDRSGRVWLVDRGGASSQVLLLDEQDEPVQVSSGDLSDVRLDQLKIAPDGVRAAAIYTADGSRRLALALVLPQRDGSIELGRVREVALDGVQAVDVAWASATALAMLGDDIDDVQPFLVELSNGSLSSRGQVAGAVSLAASPGQPLVIATGPITQPEGATERVLVRQDALQEWVPLVAAQAPTYAG
jgi:hypothetical protein